MLDQLSVQQILAKGRAYLKSLFQVVRPIHIFRMLMANKEEDWPKDKQGLLEWGVWQLRQEAIDSVTRKNNAT